MKDWRIGFLGSVLFFLIAGQAAAQCNMYELPLSQKVEQSSAIFEGNVKSSTCFWNAQHSLIFTSNIIEVFKVFKGSISSSEIELITEGGTIGNEMHTVEPNLNLSVGDIGIFMTIPTTISNPSNILKATPHFQCYGNTQGFFKYDVLTKTAIVPFKKYHDIQNEIYQTIISLIGDSYKDIKSFDLNNYFTTVQNAMGKAGSSITGFNPTTISSGTNSVLTIRGTGFGATQGTSIVQFKSPDDGGATYNTPLAFHYVSWSDTLIQIKVPAKSGTGTIQVVVGGVTTLTSTSMLTVNYAEANAISLGIPYQTDLVTLNASGGITWQMNTAFDSNALAKAAFIRALQTWSSNTQVNWTVGATTTKDTIARDSVNVVRFDNGAELPAGTLARCYYYWLGCAPPPSSVGSVWFVSELDMSVDDGTLWEFGPATPTGLFYDFETVMLHELGHGHQLGHVIDPNDVMHYSTLNSVTKRNLNVSNIAGGVDVMSRSFVANACGYGPMMVGMDENEYWGNDSFIVYPNPTSGSITIEFPADIINARVEIFNYLGTMVASMDQNTYAKKWNLDLSNLNNGVYCIVVRIGDKVISEKVVLLK